MQIQREYIYGVWYFSTFLAQILLLRVCGPGPDRRRCDASRGMIVINLTTRQVGLPPDVTPMLS